MIELECGKAPFCKNCKRIDPDVLIAMVKLFMEENEKNNRIKDKEEEYTYLDGVDYCRNQPCPNAKCDYLDDENLPF